MKLIAGQEKRFYEFMSNLNEKDKIALISHCDSDGVTSAVLASKVLGKIDYLCFSSYGSGVMPELVKELKKRKINKTIFTDLAIDIEKASILELEKFSEILIIDHHLLDFDLNSPRTVMLKAQSEYPACYMCYYLFSKIQKLDSWIAALGIIADRPHIYNASNSGNVFKDYGMAGSGNLNDLSIRLQSTIIYFRDDLNKVYEMLMNAKSTEDLDLGKYYEIVDKEFHFWLDKYKKEKEVHGNLTIFYLEPKYSVKAMLINKISAENREIFVFISKKSKNMEASCRTIGELSADRLMKESIKGIPNSFAGGHFHAAGANIPQEYLARFKENLIKAYEKLKTA